MPGSCSKQELPGDLHDRHLKIFFVFQADLDVTVCTMALVRSHNSVRIYFSYFQKKHNIVPRILFRFSSWIQFVVVAWSKFCLESLSTRDCYFGKSINKGVKLVGIWTEVSLVNQILCFFQE